MIQRVHTVILLEKYYKVLVASEGVCMGLWWKILRGERKVEREKHYTVWVVSDLMSMEQWWYDTDRGKLKFR